MKKVLILLATLGIAGAGCKKKEEKKATPVKAKKVKPRPKPKARTSPTRQKIVVKKSTHKVTPPVSKKPQKKSPQRSKVTTPKSKPKPKPKLVPDPRLLLTVADVEEIGLKDYSRDVLAGRFPDEAYDSVYYKPKKGFGIALQVWGFKRVADMRTKFDKLLADLPNAQKIPDIGGRTLFAYWDGLIYVGFEHPRKRVVVNIACAKRYCSSDQLYEIARKVYQRLNVMVHR